MTWKFLILWTLSYVDLFLFFFLSILFTIEPTNIKKSFWKTYINLTNVFEHGLTTFLSIFIFLIFLFMCPNLSVYIFVIYKWFKVRAWFTFWLNLKEIQASEYIGKNHNPIFSDSALFLKFPLSRCVWNKIYKIYCLYTFFS